MTKNQENKVSMYHLTEEKLNLHNGIWSGIPAFAATKTAFSNKIVSIHSASSLQQAIITGIATDKKVLKLALIDSTAPVAANVKAYASQTNNNGLFDAVNFSRSKLIETRDENLADICQTIHNHANTNLVALTPYGVTAPILTALQNIINAYTAKVPAPGSAKVSKKTATLNLRNHMKDTDTILKNQLDQMMLQFKTPEPDFFNDYTAAREIIDLGATHTKLRVTVKDQFGAALPGAMVSLLQSKLVIYTVVSDSGGKVIIPKVKPGTFDLKVQKENFLTKTETGILFKAGKEVKRTISLVPGVSVPLVSLIREGDVPPNSVVNIDTNGINGTPLSMIIIEVTLGPISFYAAATPNALPDTIHSDHPIGTTTLSLPDFVTAIGFGNGKELLNVQNSGLVSAHYKLTFTNLEP